MMVFTPSGQLLSATAEGAQSVIANPDPAYTLGAATDMCADPWLCPIAGGLSGAPDSLTITFPATAAFPNGMPVPVATVYVINNYIGGQQLDLLNDAASISLYAPNGAVYTQPLTSSATVEKYDFSASAAPVFPAANDPWQLAAASSPVSTGARYVLISGGSQPLHFRELFVFDTNFVNVALMKPTSSSGQLTGDPTAYASSMAVNGVIDFDNSASGDMTCSNSSAGAWWQVDLGGAYNVSSIMLFNRYLPSGSTQNNRLATYTVSFLNAGGVTVGMQALNGNAVQNYTVSLFPPTPSSSVTASNTASNTASPTVSTSLTASLTPSNTASVSRSPTQTGSASISYGTSPTQTATATVSNTATLTASVTATASATGSITSSWTPSATASPTATPTMTMSFTPLPFFLSYLYGTTLHYPATDGHVYQVSFFASVQQLNNALTLQLQMGNYYAWNTVADATCSTGQRLVSQSYTGGSTCGTGTWTTVITYTCQSYTGYVVNAQSFSPTETVTGSCTNNLAVTVNCDLNGGTMCVPLPSPTASM